MPSDPTVSNKAAEHPDDAAASSEVADGYPDDPMHVERGATLDGRLLLYFTFPHSADEPGAVPTTAPAIAGRSEQQEAGR